MSSYLLDRHLLLALQQRLSAALLGQGLGAGYALFASLPSATAAGFFSGGVSVCVDDVLGVANWILLRRLEGVYLTLRHGTIQAHQRPKRKIIQLIEKSKLDHTYFWLVSRFAWVSSLKLVSW